MNKIDIKKSLLLTLGVLASTSLFSCGSDSSSEQSKSDKDKDSNEKNLNVDGKFSAKDRKTLEGLSDKIVNDLSANASFVKLFTDAASAKTDAASAAAKGSAVGLGSAGVEELLGYDGNVKGYSADKGYLKAISSVVVTEAAKIKDAVSAVSPRGAALLKAVFADPAIAKIKAAAVPATDTLCKDLFGPCMVVSVDSSKKVSVTVAEEYQSYIAVASGDDSSSVIKAAGKVDLLASPSASVVIADAGKFVGICVPVLGLSFSLIGVSEGKLTVATS